MTDRDPFASVRGKRRDTADSLEIDRIVRLPVVELPTDEVVEAFCREEVEASHYDAGFRLFRTQVGGVLAWDLYGGLFAPIGVGWGKTLICLMIAQRAYARGESTRSVLFVPPQVYSQLVRSDIPWARRRVGLSVPFVLMGGRGRDERRLIAGSQKRGCYVLPYSYLSTSDSEALLGLIQPDLLILDEAHNVKNPKSARTKRLMRYLRQHSPRVVALSGTITSKSINDYHHLISHALRDQSPLPMSPALTSNWSMVLDAGADPSDAQTGPITPLIDWARREFPSETIPRGVPGFRAAYRLRLNTAPGVVSTGDAEIGVSLTLANQPAPHSTEAADFVRLKRLMDDVVDLWRTPSGDEIEWGFHAWRHLYELSSGFYYNLRWPTVEELTARARLSADEAEAYLEAAKKHHKTQQLYHRELRKWLDRVHIAGADTPLLVARHMAQHGAAIVDQEVYDAWREAKELEFAGMPERVSEPVRVCSYKIDHVVRWAAEHRGALVWFWHDDFGRWLYEALQAAGVDSVWCPAESIRKGMNEFLDPQHAARNQGLVIVASMGGHGTGKNLQYMSEQVLAQFPRKADLLEQVVGRTHRTGQQADELIVGTINTLPFDHMNMAACLVDALYIHQTTGSRQKAIYASYDPLPRMYPPDFLRERGFQDVAQLDKTALAALEEKFGPIGVGV